ncbi:carboxymuconolactone decarboxylase family protein [Dactylosporangium sp. AC04546]|uniref:carboxymuconolactone decarboxylase family protein n=1 Tax=Dactylosporangium sp. AC04546 TaxID=2862460 RepID=UPI001EE0DF3A|nr:carboxymuconolactone decarboxylase family protein [Dactylosporangium sp. AC04546]WVK88592.1 carboxymuconolactone decarboxylase family protein [Dactylosporangium sp. AC04546]
MTYLETPDESPLYQPEIDRFGYVPNYTRVFALRPEVYGAWAGLGRSVKSGMDLRRFELATLAAARTLRSSYCALAHGSVLLQQFFDADTLRRIAVDHHDAGLDPADVAVMDFAEKVAGDPTAITASDVDVLRRHGLTDTDILDVALAAALRCFFSTVLDAVGTEPDAAYRSSLSVPLLTALTVGRAVEA